MKKYLKKEFKRVEDLEKDTALKEQKPFIEIAFK
jgi:hypothetical protein